jgi:VanZ family protein
MGRPRSYLLYDRGLMASNEPSGEGAAGAGLPGWLLPAYCLVLVYGTLFPVSGWELPADFGWRSLLLERPGHISSTDVFTNVLMYVPLGILVAWRRRSGITLSILSATLVGAGLSYGLECLQILLPRVPSRLDLITNTLGSLAGGVFGALTAADSAIREKAWALRRTWFITGRAANVGLLALGLWLLSQWAPLVPSLDVDNLKNGLRPLWNSLRGASRFDLPQAVEYLLKVLGPGLLTATLTHTRRAALFVWSAVVCVALVGKVPILTRQLSLEALVGAGIALVLLPLALRFVPLRVGALSLIAGAVSIKGLRPAVGAGSTDLHPINWVPLAIHRLSLLDLVDLISGLWPFVALAYLTRLLAGRERPVAVALIGGSVTAVMAFGIQWAQQGVPGRFADMTDVLVALVGWFAAWLIMSVRARVD